MNKKADMSMWVSVMAIFVILLITVGVVLNFKLGKQDDSLNQDGQSGLNQQTTQTQQEQGTQDSGIQNPETDDSNIIIATSPITTQNTPDLVVYANAFSFNWLSSTKVDIDVEIDVLNLGGIASSPSSVKVMLGSQEKIIQVPALQSTEDYETNVVFNNMDVAEYTLTVTADSGNVVMEENEDNNEFTNIFAV